MQDPVFSNAEELRANNLMWSQELDAKMKRWEARHGTYEDIQREIKGQELKMRTCPLCAQVCKTQHHMDYRHRNSEACKKRVATQRGGLYIPKTHEKVTCECGYRLFRINLYKHKQGTLHQNNLQRKMGFVCDLCSYTAKGTRPKRDFEKHCLGKKHLLKISRLTARKPTCTFTQ